MYYKSPRKKHCPICEKDFKTLNVRVKYCSFACSNKALIDKRTTRRKKYELNNIEKFGEKTIYGKQYLNCSFCGKGYMRYASAIKYRGSSFCSVECRGKADRNKKPTIKQVDDLWSLSVKKRDGGKCVYCGRTNYLNSHHIFSRSKRSTRWYLPNGVTLCAAHHTLSSSFSAHKAPAEFIEWIKDRNGLEWYEDLRKVAQTIDKRPLETILEELRNMIQEISD